MEYQPLTNIIVRYHKRVKDKEYKFNIGNTPCYLLGYYFQLNYYLYFPSSKPPSVYVVGLKRIIHLEQVFAL